MWPQLPHIDTADRPSICPHTLPSQTGPPRDTLPESLDSLRGLCMHACVRACARAGAAATLQSQDAQAGDGHGMPGGALGRVGLS